MFLYMSFLDVLLKHLSDFDKNLGAGSTYPHKVSRLKAKQFAEPCSNDVTSNSPDLTIKNIG